MSNVYDHWERLVGAVIRREELWRMFHDQSPSVSSIPSDCSLDSEVLDVPFDFSSPRSSSSYQQLPPSAVENLQKKEKSAEEEEVSGLVFVQGFSPVFDLDDLLRSTAQFLGEGTFGSAYNAAMDNGITVVLKRLNAVNISEKKFRRQMEVIGNVRHENVCALKAYYFSKDEKLLVYDHYSNGSVSALLHGNIGKKQISLDWKSRLRIAVGAARGIAYIHTQVGQNLVHGNIKASNIFLNAYGYGCVSEVGLATLVSSAWTRHSQSSGYYAPEVTESKKLSQASDIYSFGVLLLELLTGKPSMLSEGNDKAIQLVSWVASIAPADWTAEVFDIELLMYQNIEKEMVKVLQIALICVESVPEHRPKMSEVSRRLDDIIAPHEGRGVV
ncbi:probable inactive receptor kinase At4g23740 [Olea europaea subsp. europaea]|uniref:Probable inactive receptor kinase At4g23740 n=1 Tax=Olea europaea subsp. europaea TaxID=158383 RepID=A0A8S0T735_OLEEU|nr:probable inactive receptor kinase At4g23740 [Olea europaea subsp. europaea]